MPALRQAAPRRKQARPLLLHQELPEHGLPLPPEERDRAAAALAAPGAHVGGPAAARGRRAGLAARRGQRLVPFHHPVRVRRPGVLLDGRPDGEHVTLTEIRARTPRDASSPRVAEVLAGLGLLEDDTVPAVRSWIDRRTAEMPPGFATVVRDWLLVLLDGDARSRPGPHHHLRLLHRRRAAHRLLVSQPRTSSGGYRRRHRGRAGQLRGWQLGTTISALRSLFRFAKKRGLIFANPAQRLKAASPEPSLLPMTDDEIRAVEQAITHPGQRLIIALAAVHAARWEAIRALTLDDLDLPNRRITIAGHPQRIGDLSHKALRAWLDHRRATWPHASNRHVLISHRTALGDAPVSRGYVNFHLKPHGVSVERIRRDRILHEALTGRPDPLHLNLMFGISDRPASQYARIACDLLAESPGQEEADPHGLGER